MTKDLKFSLLPLMEFITCVVSPPMKKTFFYEEKKMEKKKWKKKCVLTINKKVK